MNADLAHRPRVLTLNALWPGRGGGIVQDLATLQALGCEGEALPTCSVNVPGDAEWVELANIPWLLRQLEALLAQGDLRAVRLGHLGSPELVAALGALLPKAGVILVVTGACCKDPLRGLKADLLAAVGQHLLPHADLLAMNREEVEALLGSTLHSPAAVESAGRAILALGPRRLVFTVVGGDVAHQQDLYSDPTGTWWVTSPLPKILPGIGGVLDSALTAALVQPRYQPKDLLPLARGYANAATRLGHQAGAERPICGAWPSEPSDLPWRTATSAEGLNRPALPG